MSRRASLGSIVVAVASALALASCSTGASEPAAAPAAPAYPWRVERGAIRDAAGRSVVLRGANVSGAHKQAPYLGTFGPADYAALQSTYGFDAIRLLVLWAAIEPQKGAYDETYLDAIAARVGWARDAGLLVVLDMHQDLYGEGFAGGDGAPRWSCDEARYAAFKPTNPWFFGALDPNVQACVDALFTEGSEPRAHLVEAWRRVARKLAGFDNVVGFDPLNEPHWGSFDLLAFEEERLAPLYAEVTRAVRSEAPAWLVFAEPGASRNVGYPTRLPKLPFDRVVYAPHSYDPDAEGGSGFDPGKREAVIGKLREMRAEADALGAALWIGEYGGVATHPGIVPYVQAQYDGIGSVAAGSAYWSYDKSNGYGMLDPSGADKPVLTGLLARPYPMRVAGDLVAYAYDPATRVATIDLVADRAVAAPTEISVPARAYPDGVAVDCGGCAVEILAGLVRVRDAPARITIRPRDSR